MSDANGGDCLAACCGICCIFGAASFQNWCNLAPWGAGGCCNKNSTAGCCGSCCGDSFNEDAFDEQVKKDLAKTRDTNAEVEASQPMPGKEMSIPTN